MGKLNAAIQLNNFWVQRSVETFPTQQCVHLSPTSQHGNAMHYHNRREMLTKWWQLLCLRDKLYSFLDRHHFCRCPMCTPDTQQRRQNNVPWHSRSEQLKWKIYVQFLFCFPSWYWNSNGTVENKLTFITFQSENFWYDKSLDSWRVQIRWKWLNKGAFCCFYFEAHAFAEPGSGYHWSFSVEPARTIRYANRKATGIKCHNHPRIMLTFLTKIWTSKEGVCCVLWARLFVYESKAGFSTVKLGCASSLVSECSVVTQLT